MSFLLMQLRSFKIETLAMRLLILAILLFPHILHAEGVNLNAVHPPVLWTISPTPYPPSIGLRGSRMFPYLLLWLHLQSKQWFLPFRSCDILWCPVLYAVCQLGNTTGHMSANRGHPIGEMPLSNSHKTTTWFWETPMATESGPQVGRWWAWNRPRVAAWCSSIIKSYSLELKWSPDWLMAHWANAEGGTEPNSKCISYKFD